MNTRTSVELDRSQFRSCLIGGTRGDASIKHGTPPTIFAYAVNKRVIREDYKLLIEPIPYLPLEFETRLGG